MPYSKRNRHHHMPLTLHNSNLDTHTVLPSLNWSHHQVPTYQEEQVVLGRVSNVLGGLARLCHYRLCSL